MNLRGSSVPTGVQRCGARVELCVCVLACTGFRVRVLGSYQTWGFLSLVTVVPSLFCDSSPAYKPLCSYTKGRVSNDFLLVK